MTTSRKRRRRAGQKAGLLFFFFSLFYYTHQKESSCVIGVSQKKGKKKKILMHVGLRELHNWWGEKHSHTQKKKNGQSLSGEGTDGMANKEWGTFFPNEKSRAKVQKLSIIISLRYKSLSSIEYHLVFHDDQRPRRVVFESSWNTRPGDERK